MKSEIEIGDDVKCNDPKYFSVTQLNVRNINNGFAKCIYLDSGEDAEMKEEWIPLGKLIKVQYGNKLTSLF